VTAQATTTCPTCHRELVIDIDHGHLRAGATPALWVPLGPCEHVIDNFCAHANLFCSPEHLHTWRHAAGEPHGEVVTLDEISARARTAWADIATHP
jgi:Alkylmercury lyase